MPDKVLVIENDPDIKNKLSSILRDANFVVADVSNYAEALLKLAEFKPDLIIMDEELPDKDSLDACYQFRKTFNIPIILLGKDARAEIWERVLKADADFYILRPFSPKLLIARVKAILRRYKTKVQNV